MSPPKPTLQTIADKAGVSRMTASVALRGKPGVSERKRKRILKIAEELGYQVNPYVNTLMSHVRARKPIPYRATLAYLSMFEFEKQSSHVERGHYEGTRERAAELGYQLEFFWVRDKKMPLNRLFKILKARDIAGVILCRPPLYFEQYAFSVFPFDEYPWSAIGAPISTLNMHYATSDQYMIGQTTHQKLLSLGYRRVGLAIDEFVQYMTQRRFQFGFLSGAESKQGRPRVPVLEYSTLRKEKFLDWYEKYQPDVVVASSALPKQWLDEAGVNVPEEVGFASLDCEEGEKLVSGMHQNYRIVGAAAADLVISQINRNERGLPEHLRGVSILGDWIEGKTLRARKR